MSGDVINLRRARKARMRGLAENAAAENRSRFGRTKSARDVETATHALAERRFEAHRREAADRPDETDDL